MKNDAIAWSIAASDSSAGAGIQADLATFAHFGVHGCSIITKVTAQNSTQIMASYVLPDHIFAKQLTALKNDMSPDAIKISILGNENQLNELNIFLYSYSGTVIYDPVINSSTGTPLTNNTLLETIKIRLLPQVYIITPNILEAQILTGIEINNYPDMIKVGQKLLKMGVQNVLLKGGHLSSNYACDLFINESQLFWLLSPRQLLDSPQEIHGTGCHLSSAIAANLALEFPLVDAVVIAKRYINCSIRNSYLPQEFSQQRYIPHQDSLYTTRDMPYIVSSHTKFIQINEVIDSPECGDLGLYPVVDSSSWIEKLAGYGVKAVQLRIKDLPVAVIEKEIITSIKIAQQYDLKLFINDYWELAIKHRAYGVHLGQNDLLNADLNRIKANSLKLGISTHNYSELAHALSWKPSYIALGPIYSTTSKIMPWQPQGVDKIQKWQEMIPCPLVVIGGINLENIDQVIKAGGRNAAMISAIINAIDPKYTISQLLQKFQKIIIND